MTYTFHKTGYIINTNIWVLYLIWNALRSKLSVWTSVSSEIKAESWANFTKWAWNNRNLLLFSIKENLSVWNFVVLKVHSFLNGGKLLDPGPTFGTVCTRITSRVSRWEWSYTVTPTTLNCFFIQVLPHTLSQQDNQMKTVQISRISH